MRLTAYFDGRRVGWFEQRDGGRITLDYDRVWQNGAGPAELSLSLPKSRRRHDGEAPGNYLWNLLPDNADVLDRWGRRFGVSSRNPLALLAHVGLDAPGAVQLVPADEHDEPELTGGGGIEPFDDAAIAAHLRELQRDPAAWVDPAHDGGYFSLAGAQAKFTLVRTDHGWGIATGRTPSTHIVKPGIAGLALSDLDEHLTLRAASLLGLRAAHSRVMSFEDQTAIVLTRFDRAPGAEDLVVRRHQEDLAQATGIHPTAKYQADGGPGIAAVGALMRENLGRGADAAIRRFFEATMFNWALLGTDAHAKNYALLTGPGGGRPTLAPLYDLASALPYPGVNTRKVKLAMSYSGHYRAHEIEPRHIVREAERVGLEADWVIEKARHLVDGAPDALREAAREVPLTGDAVSFTDRLVDAAVERTTELRRQLDRFVS